MGETEFYNICVIHHASFFEFKLIFSEGGGGQTLYTENVVSIDQTIVGCFFYEGKFFYHF